MEKEFFGVAYTIHGSLRNAGNPKQNKRHNDDIL